MASTITVQQVVNIAQIFTELIPYTGVGGNANEPALTIANNAMQSLIAEKQPWKFNRQEMNPIFTMRGRQDYLFAGACAFGLDDAKGVGIDLVSNSGISESANTVTVNTLQPHNFKVNDTVYINGATVAAYNSVFTQTPDSSAWSGGYTVTAVPTTTSFQFTHPSSGLAVSGSAGVTNFGWLEEATMVDPVDGASPQNVRNLTGKRMLQPSSTVVNFPQKVCLVSDLGTGVLKFRFSGVPGTRLQVSLVYQAKATLLTSLSNFWTPFPDEYAFVYRQMFLAEAFKFANSPRSEVEYQKALANIMKATGQDDQEDSDEYIVPENPINAGSTGFNFGGF